MSMKKCAATSLQIIHRRIAGQQTVLLSTRNFCPSQALEKEHGFNFNEGGQQRQNFNKKWRIWFAAAGSVVGTSSFWAIKRRAADENKETDSIKTDTESDSTSAWKQFLDPPLRPELPVFTLKDVAAHKKLEDKAIWVTYKNGVYDITRFVHEHPGGDVILLAAGGSLEPFWDLYGQHKTREVLEVLEELRIGNLDPKEVKELAEKWKGQAEAYSGEPGRHPALIVKSEKPFNAETPSKLMVDHFITPTELFFVRNHMHVPTVDINKYRLRVGEEGPKECTFSLEELKSKFPKVTVTATIQCAGNRRSGMNTVKSVRGLNWQHGAISNATWSGVRLKDVLEKVLGNERELKRAGVRHVQFEGLDWDEMMKHCYSTSVPLEKALNQDAILAYEMNGKPLPLDHGFPLRVIVPGVVGARQVKWLSRIVASKEESGSMWQQRDYKAFSPSTDAENVDFKSAPAIQDAPVVSAICKPRDREKIKADVESVEVKGYAWSGGGQGIIRVDVSVDGGRTWTTATLFQAADQTMWRTWAWTLWSARIRLPPHVRKGDAVQLVCKATNASYNTQPESPEGIWNFRGLLNNSWHRIQVEIV